MYKYVEDKEILEKAHSFCSEIMNEIQEEVRDSNIPCQFFLVGSGARNMVTQNNNEPFDFDYNLNVYDGFDYSNLRQLKNAIINCCNRVMRNNNLSDVDDSTKSITSKPIYFTNYPDDEFSIDICIVTKDGNGNWSKLKHEKTGDTKKDKYLWNQCHNSKNYQDKARIIKKYPGWWTKVRNHYLEIKNKYLKKNDDNHPSFVCYIEAINDIYNDMHQKGVF